jgi:hypothetical protein
MFLEAFSGMFISCLWNSGSQDLSCDQLAFLLDPFVQSIGPQEDFDRVTFLISDLLVPFLLYNKPEYKEENVKSVEKDQNNEISLKNYLLLSSASGS